MVFIFLQIEVERLFGNAECKTVVLMPYKQCYQLLKNELCTEVK